MSNTSGRLTDYAESGGEGGLLAALTGSEKTDDDESPDKSDTGGGWWQGAKQMVKDKASDVKDAVTGGAGGGSGKGKKLKLTNIVRKRSTSESRFSWPTTNGPNSPTFPPS
ncbi:hypothetical protein [Rhodococcus opacus]|uniref:hypothetical protein n=1 Tax=Rhodococcus opacus TaxID=37919 RepID=UPI003B8A9A79